MNHIWITSDYLQAKDYCTQLVCLFVYYFYMIFFFFSLVFFSLWRVHFSPILKTRYAASCSFAKKNQTSSISLVSYLGQKVIQWKDCKRRQCVKWLYWVEDQWRIAKRYVPSGCDLKRWSECIDSWQLTLLNLFWSEIFQVVF